MYKPNLRERYNLSDQEDYEIFQENVQDAMDNLDLSKEDAEIMHMYGGAPETIERIKSELAKLHPERFEVTHDINEEDEVEEEEERYEEDDNYDYDDNIIPDEIIKEDWTTRATEGLRETVAKLPEEELKKPRVVLNTNLVDRLRDGITYLSDHDHIMRDSGKAVFEHMVSLNIFGHEEFLAEVEVETVSTLEYLLSLVPDKYIPLRPTVDLVSRISRTLIIEEYMDASQQVMFETALLDNRILPQLEKLLELEKTDGEIPLHEILVSLPPMILTTMNLF